MRRLALLLLPLVLALAAPPPAPSLWQARVAEINTARQAAGVPPLVPDARLQAVADRHLAKCVAEGGFQHVGMDGDFLDWKLTRAGLPSTPDTCIDLGASGTTQSAGIDYVDPRYYRNPKKTHYGELRNSKYRLLGFACTTSGRGGAMSVTILAAGR